MCGIVGFTGVQPAGPILLDGLKKLEYRGYDSAGIAVMDQSAITVSKVRGRIAALTAQKAMEENVKKAMTVFAGL